MKTEQIAALAVVALLAYSIGKGKQRTAAAVATESNEITSQAQWWTYAGMWSV